jgi:Protein of unknown function (DUF2934)
MDNREARIRQKAHELWEQAGRPENKAEEHWAEAERQIDKEEHEGDTDALANEPSPRGEAIDIGPGPDGNVHPIPATMGPAKSRQA